MEANKRRFNIGLVVSNIEDNFSNKVCKGAMLAAEEADVNLYIIPVKYIEPRDKIDNNTNTMYEYQYSVLLSYANLASLDMNLLCLSTISYNIKREESLEILAQFDKSTTMLLSSDEPGFSSITFNNRKGITEAVEYLLDKGITRIGMIAGPHSHSDGMERYQAYVDTLTAHDMPVNEQDVLFTDYDAKSYERIGEWFDRAKDLEAVICVDDEFAKRLYKALKERDIVIGKDVLVVGHDNSMDSAFMDPPLATIDARADIIGYQAVFAAVDYLQNREGQTSVELLKKKVDTTYIPRESVTGIQEEVCDETSEFAISKSEAISRMIDVNHQLNITMRDILMLENINGDKYQNVLESFAFKKIPSCYLYLYHREVRHARDFIWKLPDNVYLKGYRNNNEVVALSRDKQLIPTADFFSHAYLTEERKTYVLIDIYAREFQYGVFMCELPYLLFHYAESICYLISTAIKILRLLSEQQGLIDEKETILRKLQHENKQLDNLSNTDVLTELLNRRGFKSKVRQLFELPELKDQTAIMFYADLDYLKLINDKFSHEEGDFAIKKCAVALREVLGEDAVICRNGGDEFVAMLITDKDAEDYRWGLKKYMADFNEKNLKPYNITVSLGAYSFRISPELSINSLLENADDLLYKDKLNKAPFMTK